MDAGWREHGGAQDDAVHRALVESQGAEPWDAVARHDLRDEGGHRQHLLKPQQRTQPGALLCAHLLFLERELERAHALTQMGVFEACTAQVDVSAPAGFDGPNGRTHGRLYG